MRLIGYRNAPPKESNLNSSNFVFIDGIRGIAITAVVSFHLVIYTGRQSERSSLVIAEALTSYGYLGVALFIVVSGFVLMYPMTKQAELVYSKGIANFYFRRIRRIAPPYFIALVLSLALIAASPALQQPSDTAWDSKIPLTTQGVISHFLLLQDMSPAWVNQINGPLWSVAVEFHLYMIMPLVLMPLWRRVKPVLIVVGLLFIGMGMSAFEVATWAHPWLIALFAAGMLAAQIATQQVVIPHLKSLVIGGGITLIISLIVFRQPLTREIALSELSFGLLVAAILGMLARCDLNGRENIVIRTLSSKALTYLGLRSYSIYLIHSPLLALGNLTLLRIMLPPPVHLGIMVFVVAPLILGISHLFFHVVERRFITSHQRVVTS